MTQWILKQFAPFEATWNERLFVRAVYAWFLVFQLIYFPSLSSIWGESSALIRYSAPNTWINNHVYILMYDLSLYRYAIALHVTAAFFSLFHFRGVFFFRLTVWITGVLLYFSGMPALNSGYLFMLLLAFYASVFTAKTDSPWLSFLSRMSLRTVVMQTYLVYVFSALYKVTSMQWLSGEALYYSLTNDRFSWPFVAWFIEQIPLVFVVIFAYFLMVFQLFFPLWVNWKLTRKQAIWIGISLHLFIGLFLFIWDFALAMMIPYLLLEKSRRTD